MDDTRPAGIESACLRAARTCGLARTLFALLVLLTILGSLAAVTVANFSSAFDPRPLSVYADPQTAATADPAAEHPLVAQALRVAMWVGPFAAAAMAVTFLLALLLAIVGRLGGIESLTATFFWSMILAAVLLPWQLALPAGPLTGALTGLEPLVEQTAIVVKGGGSERPDTWEQILYYARFLAFPILAGLIWLGVVLRASVAFARLRESAAPPPQPSTPPEAAEDERTQPAWKQEG